MKAALVQYSPEWENPENNIITLDGIIKNNISDEDLIIFPEMTLTGFTMHSEKFAEELDGLGTQFFMNLASRLGKHIFAGIIEKDDDTFFNTLLHIDPKGLIAARYRKIHPFSYAKEDKYFTPGEEIVITKVNGIKAGLTICYDLRFPELYRKYGKEKVDLIINIANWPVNRIHHWSHLLKSRAIENLCYLIGVNRTGKDPYNKYDGSSAVYNPMGEEILFMGNNDVIGSIEFNIEYVNEIRKKFPFLEDIRLV